MLSWKRDLIFFSSELRRNVDARFCIIDGRTPHPEREVAIRLSLNYYYHWQHQTAAINKFIYNGILCQHQFYYARLLRIMYLQ